MASKTLNVRSLTKCSVQPKVTFALGEFDAKVGTKQESLQLMIIASKTIGS